MSSAVRKHLKKVKSRDKTRGTSPASTEPSTPGIPPHHADDGTTAVKDFDNSMANTRFGRFNSAAITPSTSSSPHDWGDAIDSMEALGMRKELAGQTEEVVALRTRKKELVRARSRRHLKSLELSSL